MQKKEMIIKYITVLSEMHNKKPSEALQMIYIKVLQGFEYKQLEAAFDSIVKTAKFFPKPVEIINLITGGQEDRSLTAWYKVSTAIKKHGHYSTIDFGDPLIVRAITLLGGWSQICGTNSDDMVWVQKEFERVYKNLIASKYSGKETLTIGHIEASNRMNGFEDAIPEPIKIEDKKNNLIEEKK